MQCVQAWLISELDTFWLNQIGLFNQKHPVAGMFLVEKHRRREDMVIRRDIKVLNIHWHTHYTGTHNKVESIGAEEM